jgi:hypothetical protein
LPTTVLPTSFKIARAALLARTQVAAVVADRIHWKLPSNPTYPLLIVEPVDDIEDGPGASTSRVQVNCWGNGNTSVDVLAASDLARVVASVARDLVGSYPDGDIADALPGSIIPAHDPQTGRARFILDLQLNLYPYRREGAQRG